MNANFQPSQVCLQYSKVHQMFPTMQLAYFAFNTYACSNNEYTCKVTFDMKTQTL